MSNWTVIRKGAQLVEGTAHLQISGKQVYLRVPRRAASKFNGAFVGLQDAETGQIRLEPCSKDDPHSRKIQRSGTSAYFNFPNVPALKGRDTGPMEYRQTQDGALVFGDAE